jgi:hypothetical protein
LIEALVPAPPRPIGAKMRILLGIGLSEPPSTREVSGWADE